MYSKIEVLKTKPSLQVKTWLKMLHKNLFYVISIVKKEQYKNLTISTELL